MAESRQDFGRTNSPKYFKIKLGFTCSTNLHIIGKYLILRGVIYMYIYI